MTARLARALLVRAAPAPSGAHARRMQRRRGCRCAAVAETTQAPLQPSTSTRKYVMVSGKGGVGKTSLSASLAVKYAEEGHDVLIVSTDPAHSLGDSLGQELPGGAPVMVAGTDLSIWGMEIDTEQAQEEFRRSAATGGKRKVQGILDSFGMGGLMDSLADLKLGELLDSPPPGLDEAIAISKVVEFVESERYARFSRIIFDTAPTGHTLRLLALPDFVAAALEKVARLQTKLGGAGQLVQGLFGAGEGSEGVVQRLEKLKARVDMVSRLFRDQESMDFVVATIPTALALQESSRLVAALRQSQVPVSKLVVNQVVADEMGSKYLQLKLKEQAAALRMQAESPHLGGLEVVEARMVDMEVRGVAALQYFASAVWAGMPVPPGGSVEGIVSNKDRRFYLLGGKGGVGKTTLSASLAVRMAAADVPTLVVSTDPAHSLSDSLMQDVSGGRPVAVDAGDLPLWGLEVDPEEAREELRELARGDGGAATVQTLRDLGLGGFADQLQDLQLGELLENPPPGVDEAVAIAKVVRLLRDPQNAAFRCVVFDTAPTGHTLRLLTLPDFLNTGVAKLVRLRAAIAGAVAGVTNFFSKDSKSGRAVDTAVAKLEQLQGAMEEARQLFRNQETTEFVIVSIPTTMAVAESERLAASLQREHVPVLRIVVNQMVDQGATDKFLEMRRADQKRALSMLESDENFKGLEVIKAPLLDLEVKGLPALKYFKDRVWES